MIAYRHAIPACSICSPSSEGNLSKPKVIVAQVGARRNYAVARMLHADGALAALYTGFNEGEQNWQAMWTCAIYLLFAVTLWRARAAQIPE